MPDPNTIDETLAALDGLEDAAAEEVTAPPAPEDAPAAVVVDEADPVIAAARAAAAEPEAGIGEDSKPLSNRERARNKARAKARTPLQVAQNAVRRAEEALEKAKKGLAVLQKKVDNPQRRPRDIASLNKRNREYTREEDAERVAFREMIAKYGFGERKRPMPPQAIAKE